MLQEVHIWTRDRQERWRKTREGGCLNYILKMAVVAFVGGVAVSAVYCGAALANGSGIHLPTALVIPPLGALSGLIVGRAFWGLSESSFRRMNSQ